MSYNWLRCCVSNYIFFFLTLFLSLSPSLTQVLKLFWLKLFPCLGLSSSLQVFLGEEERERRMLSWRIKSGGKRLKRRMEAKLCWGQRRSQQWKAVSGTKTRYHKFSVHSSLMTLSWHDSTPEGHSSVLTNDFKELGGTRGQKVSRKE